MLQVGGFLERLCAREQGGAAHGEEILGQQFLRHQARPLTRAVAHADVHVLAREIDQAFIGEQAHVEIGMDGAKAPEAAHQPSRRERRQARHGHGTRAVARNQARGRGIDAIEGVLERGQIGLPRLGQNQRAILPPEQAHAQAFLEPLHLMTDRRLGDVQLIRGLGERQMARRRFEGAQRIEGRKMARHGLAYR